MTMWLKVGELAARCGLTVRALHHYEALGLLVPATRSEAGYRLYGRADVARLHAIQALRTLGLSLRQIGPLLDGQGGDMAALVERQVRALDRQIAQARTLRNRLLALGAMLGDGREPGLDDWLASLQQMHAYGRCFNDDEVLRIARGWAAVAADWPPLLQALRAACDRGAAPTDPEVQALTQRWMSLMHRWLGGDFALMARWGEAYAQEPALRGAGVDLALVRFVEQAAAPRMALWQAHFSLDELARLQPPDPAAMQALQADVAAARAQGLAPDSAEAAALVRRWLALLSTVWGGDAALARRLAQAYAASPGLRAGSALGAAAMDWLLQAGLPPCGPLAGQASASVAASVAASVVASVGVSVCAPPAPAPPHPGA